MNAGMLVRNYLISAISFTLSGLFPSAIKADPDFLPKSHLKTIYSRDIAAVDNYSIPAMNYQIQTSNRSVSLNIQNTSSSFQSKIGTSVYKAVTTSTKKLTRQAAGSAILYGVEYFGYGTPLQDGIRYLKQKTRYSFGDCGQLRFSTKRLKARSCITDQTEIELNSNYKLDAFSLNFKWAL